MASVRSLKKWAIRKIPHDLQSHSFLTFEIGCSNGWTMCCLLCLCEENCVGNYVLTQRCYGNACLEIITLNCSQYHEVDVTKELVMFSKSGNSSVQT